MLVFWLTRYVSHHSLPLLNAFRFPFQIIKVAISTYLPKIGSNWDYPELFKWVEIKKISSRNGSTKSKDFLSVFKCLEPWFIIII
ncbi:hypothetical protein Hanom_Chr12g01106701 [Helianthus anomalus]